jgi:predicted MFS family arabinose efflux permease
MDRRSSPEGGQREPIGASEAAHEDLEATETTGGRELALVVALSFAMLASTFPEFSIGVLAPFLVEELPVGEAAIGVAASLMYLGAAVVARGAGRTLDGISGRSALTLLYGASIGALALLAASRSIVWLLAAGIVASAGLGINNPVTSRLIVAGVRPGRRGLAIGVKQTGVKVGQTLAGATLPCLAVTVGWRTGLVVICLGGLALLLISLPAIPRGASRLAPVADRGSVAAARAQVRWLQYYSFAMAVGQSALTIYLALYAVQRIGTTVTEGGLLVATFALTATATRLVWVTAAERLIRPDHALLFLSGGSVVGLVLIVVAAALGPALLWAGAIVTGATVGTWNVVVQYTILTEVDPDRTAVATGTVQAGFMLGLALGAPMFGALVESLGSFDVAWALAIVMALAAGAAVLRRRRL